MADIPRDRVIDGAKYLWDGRVYESQRSVGAAMQEYERDNYESRLVSFGDRFLVYLRRKVQTAP